MNTDDCFPQFSERLKTIRNFVDFAKENLTNNSTFMKSVDSMLAETLATIRYASYQLAINPEDINTNANSIFVNFVEASKAKK